jgi:hypothetical protein
MVPGTTKSMESPRVSMAPPNTCARVGRPPRTVTETKSTTVPSHGDLLARLIDPRTHPALSRTVAAGGLDEPAGCTEVDFDFGLQRTLDGIAALVVARGGGTTAFPTGTQGAKPRRHRPAASAD